MGVAIYVMNDFIWENPSADDFLHNHDVLATAFMWPHCDLNISAFFYGESNTLPGVN